MKIWIEDKPENENEPIQADDLNILSEDNDTDNDDTTVCEPMDPDADYGQDKSDKYIRRAMLYEILLAVVLLFRSRVVMYNYLTALMPMLLFTGTIGYYSYKRNANMKLFSSICYLASTGIALQLMIDRVFVPLTTFSLIKYWICLALAILFIIFYSFFRKLLNQKWTVYLMMGATVAIYLLLAVKGVDPNGYGTKAWLSVMGHTVQLTDFTKVTALLFYGALFSSEYGRDERQILWISSAYFLLNLAGSLVIRELGSFFILFFLHLALIYIFVEHSRRKRIYLITIFGLCVFAVGISFMFYKLLLPYAQSGSLNSITALIWPIAKKVYERFSITANIYSDPYGAGYQLLQGKKALWMGGLFGNTVNFTAIPVPESDMAFVVLILLFGYPLAVFALFQLAKIAMYGGQISRRWMKQSRQDAVVVFGAAAMLFAQGMIVILGSCNVIPFTGLPIPFLSRGGTYQAIALCFTGILLHMSEEQEAAV